MEIVKDAKQLSRCPFNREIDCAARERKCESCGWNPEVDAERKARRSDPDKQKRA